MCLGCPRSKTKPLEHPGHVRVSPDRGVQRRSVLTPERRPYLTFRNRIKVREQTCHPGTPTIERESIPFIRSLRIDSRLKRAYPVSNFSRRNLNQDALRPIRLHYMQNKLVLACIRSEPDNNSY